MNCNERYIRNLMLDGFDEESQLRLKASRVGVVGAGALGSVVAMYLAAAGTGRLRITDDDAITLSNLQRQVFFSESEVGEEKSEVLERKIRGLNSSVEVERFGSFVETVNIARFFAGCDVIAECSDNPSSKALCVKTAREIGVPVVVGGVNGYKGQIGVFGPSASLDYIDIFPEPLEKVKAPGVFSPVPGVVASLQAAEILKILARVGESGESILLDFDVRDMQFRKFNF